MKNDPDNPYLTANQSAYERWRERKLILVEKLAPEVTQIKNPHALSTSEYEAISAQMAAHNLALFSIDGDPAIGNQALKALGAQVGLQRLDSNLYANDSDISELRVIDKGRRGEYIPYTNRPLGWHTDGYYNLPEKTIRSFVLYCVNDAAEGGENQLLDPELAYLHLRDADSRYIDALMQPDTLTIPETIEADNYRRPAQSSPVFQVDPLNGNLLMRYTQRKTHIEWRQDDITREALSLLGDLLAGGSAHILKKRLAPGEGLFCNNVLHNRSGFNDTADHQRVMLRARYYDRFKEYAHA